MVGDVFEIAPKEYSPIITDGVSGVSPIRAGDQVPPHKSKQIFPVVTDRCTEM